MGVCVGVWVGDGFVYGGGWVWFVSVWHGGLLWWCWGGIVFGCSPEIWGRWDWGVVVRSGGSKTWGFCSLTGIRPMKKEKESTLTCEHDAVLSFSFFALLIAFVEIIPYLRKFINYFFVAGIEWSNNFSLHLKIGENKKLYLVFGHETLYNRLQK